MPFKIVSPAKINIYLNILGRDPQDNYHYLVSVMEKISLCDYIYIEPKNSCGLNIKTEGYKINPYKNSLRDVYNLFFERFDLSQGFNIFLKKNIPPGAGLGGHSSNASYFALFLNKFLRLGLSCQDLSNLLSSISKDTSFFLKECSFAVVRGKGEVVEPLSFKNKFSHILAIYPRGLSTKRVFSQFRLGLTRYIDNVNIILKSLREKDFVLLKQGCFNALERSAVKILPLIDKVKDFFLRNGMEITGMSGSGPTVFAIELKKRDFPKEWGRWHFVRVKTF